MKNRSFSAAVGIVFAAVSMVVASSAYAATPSLSLSSNGGSSVVVTVNGDPNSQINFYYNVASASGMQVISLGYTNANGSFTTTINSGSYNIIAGNSVYVIVNGQQSPLEPWPSTVVSGSPVLSQNSVTVGLGQSVTVISQVAGTGVYMEANSNSAVAGVSASNNNITVTGEQPGSTVVSVCYVGTSSNCTNLAVTVQVTSVSNSVISFSQNNLSLLTSSNQAVVISGGNGIYSVSGNSNTGVVSTNLSGSTLTVYALSTGTATITVCDQSGNCAPLTVTVNATVGGQSVTFGITNPSIPVGQTISISLSGSSAFFLSSNANTNLVQASVNGSSLSLTGLQTGSDSITVCAANSGCNAISVTVTGTTTTTTVTNTNTSLLSQIQSLQSQLAQALTQIQSIQTQLTQIAAAANLTVSGTTATNSGTTVSSAPTTIDLTEFLSIGSMDDQVTQLQQQLTKLGFYSGSITGYFGALTEAAVEKYQTAHGITPAGYVGPSTRAALNAGS